MNNNTLALASLSLCMLLSSLGANIANVALPTLALTFGASFQHVQWVVIVYLLAITTLIVSVGRLGDIIGRKRLLLIGLVIFTLASILCSLAPNLFLLIIARALQGFGGAIMMALTMAFVGDIVPKADTGKAMGLLGTMSAVGTTLGPSLGGVLIAIFGWHAIFMINVPLGILTAFLLFRTLPKDHPIKNSNKTSFDFIGTFLLAITLASYALAMTIGGGHFGLMNMILLFSAGVWGVLFVLVEQKIASPLMRIEIFKDAVLNSSLAISTMVTTVLMATFVVGPFYLSHALGLKPEGVGMVMSVGPIIVALTAVPFGRIVDKFGTNRMIIFGLIGIIVGCCMLSMIPITFGILGYVMSMLVVALGYSLFQTSNNTAVMKDVIPEQRGVISGMLNLSRNLGLITGASVMGAIFAFASGTSDISTAPIKAVASGMHATFAVGTILIIGSLAIVLKVGPRK